MFNPRSTRAAVLVAALFSLVLGGFAAVAPPAGAEVAGEVPFDVQVSPRVFYPEPDRYLDRVEIRVFESPATDETVKSIDVTVVDAEGTVVHDRHVRSAALDFEDGALDLRWNGREDSFSQDVLPPGDYDLTVTIVDADLDTKSVVTTVSLRPEELRLRTWTKRITPRGSMINSDIRSCGRVLRPARPRWDGSLGYRTRECSDPNESVAWTAHGVYLPRPTVFGSGSIQVDVVGGRARREPPARLGYWYYWPGKGWAEADERFGPELQRHPGIGQAPADFVDGWGTDRRLSFVWSVGLHGGRDYDVKRFVVVYRYWLLE